MLGRELCDHWMPSLRTMPSNVYVLHICNILVPLKTEARHPKFKPSMGKIMRSSLWGEKRRRTEGKGKEENEGKREGG